MKGGLIMKLVNPGGKSVTTFDTQANWVCKCYCSSGHTSGKSSGYNTGSRCGAQCSSSSQYTINRNSAYAVANP